MKFCIIMRGIPGSGKSTFTDTLNPKGDWVVCSADKFFIVNGEYKFDGSKLRMAHEHCEEKFLYAIERHRNIVIDNCNILKKNWHLYANTARKEGYVVISATMEEFDVDKCFERNSHKVPRETIARYAKSFER